MVRVPCGPVDCALTRVQLVRVRSKNGVLRVAVDATDDVRVLIDKVCRTNATGCMLTDRHSRVSRTVSYTHLRAHET